ncbi:MAG TPA: toxin-antitoxin system HicB family antitoxin, partial [Acidimicrobiales bacterium]|nr:toxin-antitoxin system HicB family antitoxin [Acidimicrobiales bacterium]
MFSRSAPSRILDLLSAVAAELSDQIPNGRIEIRLVGDDVEVAYVDEQPPAPESDSELSSRITLRLSEQLKARVEESATREGISVNTYILRVLERGAPSSAARSGRVGSRLRGYGTS